MFYQATKKELHEFKPVAKLLVVSGVYAICVIDVLVFLILFSIWSNAKYREEVLIIHKTHDTTLPTGQIGGLLHILARSVFGFFG